jgi:lipid-A-disaccharide synthase
MRYYIIAGEASGDLHGSNLMKALYAQDPAATVRFWGGPKMNEVYKAHESGTGLVADYRDTAVMGIVQVLKQGRTLVKRIESCQQDILAWKPDAVVLIDYPGFNLRIAQFAHNAGFKVFYYIAPKVWGSRESRVAQLKAYVDKLFIVFPFEKPYFERQGVPFVFVGNPLVDALAQSPQLTESKEAFLERTGLPDQPWIALLAGSRTMEIRSMMPVYMELASAWHETHPNDLFVVAAAPSRTLADYQDYIGDRPYVKVVFGETYGALKHARAAVINSGTASLEAAIIGTPQLVSYKLSSLVPAWLLRKYIKVKYISLGNLILDRLAFREYVQNEVQVPALYAELTRLCDDAAYRKAMLASYAQIRTLLGSTGASETAAREIISALQD